MFAAFACSALVAGLVARHGESLGLLHAPNHRSSHCHPTPSGGAIGIVFAGLLSALWLGLGERYWQALLAAIFIAGIGLWDDVRYLPAWGRLTAQVCACLATVYVYEAGLPSAVLLGALLLAGVWWINLFNFMDGIDGLAAVQAIFMLLSAAGLAVIVQPEVLNQPEWLWMLVLASATLGFLSWNWPPARVFMGDVGSTFLAYVQFFLALITISSGWLSLPVWLILGAVFTTDATLTLLRRMFQGDRWWEAHREHAYQRLARYWGSHRNVTLLVLSIDVLFLLPLAIAAQRWDEWRWELVGLAHVLLIMAILPMLSSRKLDD